MTDELIELEYAHLALDKKLKGGKEEFEDPEYDDYDKETEETDAQLSYEYDMPTSEAHRKPSEAEAAKPTATEPDDEYDDEDWEDVETDALDN